MVRVFSLQSRDQKFELGKAAQALEARILQEVRPAGESGADTSLQPLKSGFASPGEGERAGYLIIRVVRVAKRLWTRTGPGHTINGRISIFHQGVEQALQTDDERFIRDKLKRFVDPEPGLFPVPSHHGGEGSKIKRVLVARTLCPPDFNLVARQIIFLAPDIYLNDARAHSLPGLKRPSPFKHRARMIEQSDMCEDAAETVVGMRQIVLQGQSPLEIGNRLQMLEVLRRSPEQKSARHVPLGKIRVNFEGSPAVEFRLLQPHAGRVEFEMVGCTGNRERRMSKRKSGIASHSVS